MKYCPSFLCAALVSISAAFSTPAFADSGMSEAEVLALVTDKMPKTEWVSAHALNKFPGYFQLQFADHDDTAQYFFDAERRVMVIGMMINLDPDAGEAASPSIAPGRETE